MLKDIFVIKKSDRPWHLPIVAGVCIGIPLLAGYFTGHIIEGKLASLAGLVILYIQSFNLAKRMITLMACSFGIICSFALGSVFSYNPFIAPVALGFFAFMVHLALYYLRLSKPPGNFFFIMIASVAICMPFNAETIFRNTGLVSIGAMTACFIGFVYSLLTLKPGQQTPQFTAPEKTRRANLIEAVTFGVFIGLSLFLGQIFKLENPYWIPTSCAAVMQGASTTHVLSKSLQRIVGTFIGLLTTWALLSFKPALLAICISIIILQIIIEFLVVRNYGLAAIFITALTIFMAESSASLASNPGQLFLARFIDILIGSSLGAIGGWVLHNEHIHYYASDQTAIKNEES